jgi:hypothetical protein
VGTAIDWWRFAAALEEPSRSIHRLGEGPPAHNSLKRPVPTTSTVPPVAVHPAGVRLSAAALASKLSVKMIVAVAVAGVTAATIPSPMAQLIRRITARVPFERMFRDLLTSS